MFKRVIHRIVPYKLRSYVWHIINIISFYKWYYLCRKKNGIYLICKVGDAYFIGGSKDIDGVMGSMIRSGCIFAKEEIELFYLLTNRFNTNISRDDAYFIDVGANIGTTSIYFKKYLKESSRIIAYEPDSNNYAALKANVSLNNLDNEIKCIRAGLGEDSLIVKLNKHPENPGGNSIINSPTNDKEDISIIRLDDSLKSMNIDPEDIGYIWIDTEGYEPYVLFGGVETIKKTNASVFMEFNPHVYCAIEGLFDKLMIFLAENWTKYIDIKECLSGRTVLHDIIELKKYKGYNEQVGDIFLIR